MGTTRSYEEPKKGSAELLLLALLAERPRHGYEISKLIEERSGGELRFHVASLYPTLYRLEKRGLIKGRWASPAGERRRRTYRLTPAGQRALTVRRAEWSRFFAALDRVAGLEHA